MCSILTPEFSSSDYVSFGLASNWLTLFGSPSSLSSEGYLLISQTTGLNNGRFKIPDSSSFRVYSSSQTPGVNGSSATNGQLTAGDKIYHYDGTSIYTLIGTVDNQLDGLYDDLKIHFTVDTSSTYLSDLGVALQYAGASIDSRSFDVSLSVAGSTPVVDTLPVTTLNKTGDGFTFAITKPSYSENGSAVFVAGSSDATIAYSAKDTLLDGTGNYNGINLVITATNDLTALASQLGGSPNTNTPEGISALLKLITIMFSEFNAHALSIDASGKSFSYDTQNQTLNVNSIPFASVVIGDSSLAGVTSIITIQFNNDLATTALVNEVLQSITYQNTTSALMPLGVLSWSLQDALSNNSSLVSGQSLLTFQNVNDAPILQPFYKTGNYDALLDFATQDYKATAVETGVYSSTGTQVLSSVNVAENDTSFAGVSSALGFLSNQSAVMVGDLTAVGGSDTSSVITFDTAQASVSLTFANLLKTLASLLASGDQAGVGNLVGDSIQTFLMGLPYRKISFYGENNELLGVSQITESDIPSLGLLFSVMSLMQGGSASDLDMYTSDSLYNVRFTAPQGHTIKSIKIESISTMLSQLVMNDVSLPSILDSITLGENADPYLNLPPLTAGQVTEFVVSDMLPNGTISDPDALPWEKSTVPESIAVSAVDNSQGLWKYKIGSGTWTEFDFATNSGKALLLNETDSLQFTPNQDFNGILVDGITFYAWDKTTGNVGDYLIISGNTGDDKTLSVNAISASAMTPQAPTLSEITAMTSSGDGEQVITFASLLDGSNAADLDGTVSSFVVKNVSSGTLKIGTDAVSATDWAEGTNDTINVLKKAFWTPQGSSNAFTVVAKDNDGTESNTPVTVRINSGLLVTTNSDDDAIGVDLATDLTDGGGLSLREALHYVNDGGVIRFDLSPANNTITLADVVADVKAGVTFDVDDVGTLTIAGSTLNLIGALTITNGANDNLTISSNLITGDGSFVKQGMGNLTLSGTNSGLNAFDGIMTVVGGSLTISSDTNLGNGYVQIGTTGATVNEETRSVLKITGTGEQEFDNVIMIGASEGEVWIDENLIVWLNGKLDEPEVGDEPLGNDLVKTGLGTLVLANVGQFDENDELIEGSTNEDGLSGDIFVDEGDVQVASDDALPAGEIYLAEGKEMEFEGDAETTLNNAINLNGDANFNVASENKVVTISGEIKGGEGKDFTKKGNGTVNLTGDSTFAGETKVDAGTFLINGSMANTASVTVGGTLGGSGTIGTEGSKGAVTVSSTGTLAPGNSPGQITLKNGLTLSTGAKLSIQLKHGTIDTNATPKVYGYDQVIVKGAVNITGSNLVLGLENNYNFNDGTVFKIIDNDAADAVTGTFSGLSNGSTVTANGKYFTINYAGGDGNDVTLTSFTPTPEPEPTPAPTPVPTPTPIPTPAPVFEKPVSKDVESQVPSASGVKGDGNGDGIADVDQKNVISLPTQKDLVDTKDAPKVFLSIELPQGQTLTKAEVKSVPVSESEKITFKTETVDKKGNTVVTDTPITKETAPFGLFEFNFAGVQSIFDSTTGAIKGGTTAVKLYLDDKQTVENYLKQTVSGTWEQIPFTYVYDEKLGKTVVSISLTDGDKFDLDGKIDGGISDPGTPIITPKLTVAPVPIVELSAPTEKVFVGYGSEFELTSGAAQVFGSSLREVLTLKAGASNIIVDQNVEQVNLAGKFADFTFEQQGNSLNIINNSITVAKITVQDDSNGTLLGFTDGLRSAIFTNAKISVVDKIVAADDVPLAILQKAGIYLAGVTSNPLTVGGNWVSIYGSQASDKVGLSAFATNATIDANVEQVNFSDKFADYSFIPVGNSLNVLSGTTKIANIVIQDDSNGTTLNFSDQSYSAHFVTSATTLQIEITGISAIA